MSDVERDVERFLPSLFERLDGLRQNCSNIPVAAGRKSKSGILDIMAAHHVYDLKKVNSKISDTQAIKIVIEKLEALGMKPPAQDDEALVQRVRKNYKDNASLWTELDSIDERYKVGGRLF